jgi:folate-binding protein YgfZ
MDDLQTSINIHGREYTLGLPLNHATPPEYNALFDLSYLGVITLEGNNGLSFLQGQLTCDTRTVNANHMQPGALCQVNGRVLALLDVIAWDGLHLILPKDMIASTISTLNKVARLSRLQLKESSTYNLLGFYCHSPNGPIPFNATLPKEENALTHTEAYCCYRINEHRYCFLVKTDHLAEIDTSWPLNHRHSALAWRALELETQRIEIYPASRGLFLPHRLRLHETSRISFKKGCYLGQEIIARMQYRGTEKHILKTHTIQTTQPLQVGQVIHDPITKRVIGELIDSCPLDEDRQRITISILIEHPLTVLLDGHDKAVTLKH